MERRIGRVPVGAAAQMTTSGCALNRRARDEAPGPRSLSRTWEGGFPNLPVMEPSRETSLQERRCSNDSLCPRAGG